MVKDPRGLIKKATLMFVAMLFWLLVRHRLSPSKVHNVLIGDRAVILAVLVAGVDIDFSWMILVETHKRALQTSTTYPFPSLIFKMCTDPRVPIWQCDTLHRPTRTLDIGLIKDEAYVTTCTEDPKSRFPK